jgi:glycosyltransferase involved in cell wall biosynthesis
MESKTDFRVIHVFPYSARLSGGHSNAILAFIEGQLRYGMDVRAISPCDKNIPPDQGTRIQQLPVREMDFDAPGFWPAAMESAAGCPHPLFHFHGTVRSFLRPARNLAKAGIPYVVSSHGQLSFRSTVHWFTKFVYLNFVTRFVRNAGGLHFLTERASLRCRYLLPFWRRPVLVHPNVVNVPDPDSVAPASREQYGIPAGAFVFAYLGRLQVDCKGLDLVVRALVRLPAAANAHLVLIGSDWAGGRQILADLAKALNCEDRIRFPGPLYGGDKWRALRMADAFVSPSRWEAFSVAQAEAIGFRVPTIVSTSMEAAPEMVRHQAALASQLSPDALARAMQRLVEESQLRRSLADCGRKWVLEKCSLPTVGAPFTGFYRRVLHLKAS